MSRTSKRFGIALSFPGEQRPFVAQVAGHLAERIGHGRVLYDAYYEAEFARPDLDTYLQRLYHDESELIAVFLCADYERKEWCGLEWRAVRDLIKRRRGSAVMLLRFDDTEIPGLFSTDGYVWIGDGRDPMEAADLILQRWQIEAGQPPNAGPPALAKPEIDLLKLPTGASSFLGREAELALLDDAWVADGGTRIVELVAPGGVGKTALVKRWLDRLKADGWRGAERVYGWSFGSQGSGEDRQASDDGFLAAALAWFQVEHDPALGPWGKGRLLARAVVERRTLLVLDGVEPLQYPPGPLAGSLRTPGLQALLVQLASAGQPGLILLTTRERIADLAEYERREDYPGGSVARHDLSNLSHADGARLLHELGCCRAGAAAIEPDDRELVEASREVRGHALTLALLGGYLAQAHWGDIRRRAEVRLQDADETRGGKAFQVMAAYETWFAREGEHGARELAALRLIGFFDRSADVGCLAALREAPPIPGLSEPLVDLSAVQWNITLSRLEECGLIERGPSDGSGDSAVDAHPLVREYLAARLREHSPDAWREGHRRLYEHLRASVPYRPEGLAGLEPLYEAVAHGCLAGLHEQAWEGVYIHRISRGNEKYVIGKLGAFGADLAAVACFFDEPWWRVSPTLSAKHQALLLNHAAFRLRALGRLGEALAPFRAALEIRLGLADWVNAAITAGNLSQAELALGRLANAVEEAGRSVDYANRSGDGHWRKAAFSVLADALHQQGHWHPARDQFAVAEAIQAEWQPQFALLYGFGSFLYCDLLLAEPERAAWRRVLSLPPRDGDGEGLLDTCRAVEQRAAQTLLWADQHGGLLEPALDRLSLARAVLVRALLENSRSRVLGPALGQFSAAVDGLRAAGRQDLQPPGLIARAWLHALLDDPDAARADLDEAWRISSRGGMRLHMADVHLHRARLFGDKAELARARALIEGCGYWRRREELEDAETAAADW